MNFLGETLKNSDTRDHLIWGAHWARNYARIGQMGLKWGPRRTVELLRRYPWLKVLLQVNNLHGRLTKGRRGRYREANATLISQIVHSVTELVTEVFSHPERTVIHEDLVPPEILYGMGLNPWMAEFMPILMPFTVPTSLEPYIDVAESCGVPPDVCSLPKGTMGIVLNGEMPPAAALLASNMPCDGGMSQYTIIERKLKVPTFRLDIPYNFYDEHAVTYCVGELRRLIDFLEEHTPGRMDWDRLRMVCDERNRARGYELDLWDLLRARPAPLAAETVYLTHMMFSIAQPGLPRSTRVFQTMARLAQDNVQTGVGAVTDERYRIALWNPPTLNYIDIFSWAEQAYGAVMVMDMLSYNRHPFIDTTTPETMLEGLARIIMQGPMARHTRGPAENFFTDLFYLYEHFGLDMIWMAGHVGCKNTQALSGMFREKCRNRRIPLLFIDYDLADTRAASASGIRDQVSLFMETVMQAERLDREELEHSI